MMTPRLSPIRSMPGIRTRDQNHPAELSEIEHLHIQFKPVLRAQIPDASLLLLYWSAPRKTLTSGRAQVFSSGIVEEILPVSRDPFFLELAILIGQEAIGAGGDKPRQFIFATQSTPESRLERL